MTPSVNASVELRRNPISNDRVFLTKANNQINCVSRVAKRCVHFARLIPDVVACTATHSRLEHCRIFYGDRTPEIVSIACPDVTTIGECVVTVSIDNAILIYYNRRFNELSICVFIIVCMVILLRYKRTLGAYLSR